MTWCALALLALQAAPTARAESTAVLPKGVRTLLYRHVQADVPGAFDDGSAFNTFRVDETLTGAKVAAAYKPASEIIEQVKAIDPKLANEIDFGRFVIDPEVRVQVEAFAFGWGLGADTMVVGILPFWKAQVDLRGPGFIPSDALKRVAGQIEQSAAKSSDPERSRILSQILASLPQVQGANLQDILVSRYGYKPLGHWGGEGIGDAEIFLQHRYLNLRSLRLAARLGTSLPTGRADDPDNLTDVPFGAGHVSTYFENLADWFIWRDWLILSAGLRYQYSWRANAEFRLIEDPSFPLTKEKERLDYKPGDRTIARASLDAKVFGPLRLQSGYSVETRSASRFSGWRSDYDYGILSQGTDAEIHTWETALKFSTVKMYQQKQFWIPLDATVSYSRVVKGRNTELVNMAYGELALYF